MTGFAAAVVEAWQELRIHKLRVLLSLIGVGVAVCSLTAAVAVGTTRAAFATIMDNFGVKYFSIVGDSMLTTVKLQDDQSVTATVIGQLPKDTNSGMPTVYMLPETYNRWFGAGQLMNDASYQMWVSPTGSKELGKAVKQQLRTQLPGVQVELNRQDYAAYGGDQFREFKYVVGGWRASWRPWLPGWWASWPLLASSTAR